jgi:hypothetical protein
MDHTYIRDRNITDLYLLGQLSDKERVTFEEHYFECEECVRTLELARSFQSGMQDAVLDRPQRASAPWRV